MRLCKTLCGVLWSLHRSLVSKVTFEIQTRSNHSLTQWLGPLKLELQAQRALRGASFICIIIDCCFFDLRGALHSIMIACVCVFIKSWSTSLVQYNYFTYMHACCLRSKYNYRRHMHNCGIGFLLGGGCNFSNRWCLANKHCTETTNANQLGDRLVIKLVLSKVRYVRHG